MLRSAMGVGGVRFSGKDHYEGVRFNVISITRGVGVKFPGKKRYVTLEWPPPCYMGILLMCPCVVKLPQKITFSTTSVPTYLFRQTFLDNNIPEGSTTASKYTALYSYATNPEVKFPVVSLACDVPISHELHVP